MLNFIKRHKILTIILTVLLAVIITLIILIFTLFSLKNISIELKTDTVNITEEVQQEIIQKIEDENISTVIFVNKDKIITELEKDYPYLKIVNIETVIPSSFVVHCAEREEFYAVQSSGNVYYLDEELKVLRIEEDSTYTKTETNAVLLNISELELNLEYAKEGQFINFSNQNISEADESTTIISGKTENILLSLLKAFESNNRRITDVLAGYTTFEIEYKVSGENILTCLKIVDSFGFETEIIEADIKLSQKIQMMINVQGEMAINDPSEFVTHKLTIYENSGVIKNALELK